MDFGAWNFACRLISAGENAIMAMACPEGAAMKRLHLVMLLVVMVFAGIFLGNLFGGRRGSYAGCAAGVVLVGALLWVTAPREFARNVRAIERKGLRVENIEEAYAQFLRAVRIPAAVLMLLGFVALVVLLIFRIG